MAQELALKTFYCASVSGGKDSLYMLRLILEHPDQYPLHGIVHFELEIDYPFIKNVINEMKRLVEPLHIPFLIFRPRKSYYELYDSYGFSTHKNRWCNSHYKMDCSRQLDEYLLTRGEKRVYYIGFCADEQKRFRNDIYPLADYNIVENEILEWARTQPIFNGYYETNRRCGCFMCPLATFAEDKYLLTHYPDLFQQKMIMARRTEEKFEREHGRPFSVWQPNPKYNTLYRVHKLCGDNYITIEGARGAVHEHTTETRD